MKKRSLSISFLPRISNLWVAGCLFWIFTGLVAQALEDSEEARQPSRGSQPISESLWHSLISKVSEGISDSIVVQEFFVSSHQLNQLQSLCELRELVLDGGRVDDVGLQKIVHSCPRLEHLRLRYSPIGDAGAAMLAQLEDLRILNLPQCRITDKGLRQLKSLQKLEQLRLGGKQLSDPATEVIAQFPALKSLHLIRPELTDQSLRNLSKSPKLSSLYLDECDLGEEAWLELSRHKPGLHVHLNQPHSD